MIVTYFRSSSYNCWGFCPMQYYLTYVLGLKPTPENGWRIPKPQKKADKGTITHKALELLASRKLAEQEGRPLVVDDETGKEWPTEKVTPELAIDTAWDHYTHKFSHHDWEPADYKDCRKWMFMAMELNGGMFSPLRRHVIWPERYFDFTIDKPWARYAYDVDGKVVEGQLSIKGSIDLVCRVDEDPEVVELVDWKTGERKDWATGKPKEYKSLRVDPQLRLYHYALSRLCPDAREIIITIVYIRSGGAFSLPFSRDDLPETERMIEQRFNVIKDCHRPQLIKGTAEGWKCKKLCTYGMNEMEPGGRTVCDHINREIITLGLDKVTRKYGQAEAYLAYGDGGGKTDRKGEST